MDDRELELLRRARGYIQTMAEGRDPITGADAPDNDVINNVKVSRCLFYVAGVLDKLLSGEISVAQRHYSSKKQGFFLTEEQREQLAPFDRNVFAKELLEKINRFAEENGCFKFQAKWITSYFLSIGMMYEEDGAKKATESGEELGIITERRLSEKIGYYWVNKYTPEAQQFILDHLDEMAAGSQNGADSGVKVVEMFLNNSTPEDISAALDIPLEDVNHRLEAAGLLDE